MSSLQKLNVLLIVVCAVGIGTIIYGANPEWRVQLDARCSSFVNETPRDWSVDAVTFLIDSPAKQKMWATVWEDDVRLAYGKAFFLAGGEQQFVELLPPEGMFVRPPVLVIVHNEDGSFMYRGTIAAECDDGEA